MIRIGLLSAQRARAERALLDQAAHDPSTQLPNRRTLIDRPGGELARGSQGALLFCDLDAFKEINDRFGHTIGDQLLIEVDRLRRCVPEPHLVGRFGGDEFVILLIGTTPTETQAIPACVIRSVARPFAVADGAVVGVSVGLALADDERDPEELLRTADRAMHRAKAMRAGDTVQTSRGGPTNGNHIR